jgi:hypothetical protein
MNGPGEAVGFALLKAYGLKVVLGMVGAALLYLVLPPVKPDGSFDRREFVLRLAAAGVFSSVFGDWAVAMLMQYVPSIQAEKHASPVYLMVGAPGWWVSRAVALWLQRRSGKDIGELVGEAKGMGQ